MAHELLSGRQTPRNFSRSSVGWRERPEYFDPSNPPPSKPSAARTAGVGLLALGISVLPWAAIAYVVTKVVKHASR